MTSFILSFNLCKKR